MNKFKKTIYNILRNYVKKYLTGNLGKVVEDEEKITCYVEKNKIKKEGYRYIISCRGIGKVEEQNKIAKAYNLDKPICYVIDGFESKNNVNIYGSSNCEIIVRNCNFMFDVFISVDGKCILDNTVIQFFSNLSISADELIIKNTSLGQIDIITHKSNVRVNACKKVDVVNSNIGNRKQDINVSFIATNELNLVNSNIRGKEVLCESSKIVADKNSSLIATNTVNLQTDNFSSINIDAPTIVLNGEEIENNKKSVVLKETNPLALKRLELVNLLKKVKIQCENINSKKVLKYQKELNVQPVSKVLKK